MQALGDELQTLPTVHLFLLANDCLQYLCPVQVPGDTLWTLTAVDSLQFTCLYELLTNVSLWVEVGGQLRPNLGVIESLCPNNCSLRGQCVKGSHLFAISVLLVAVLCCSVAAAAADKDRFVTPI